MKKVKTIVLDLTLALGLLVATGVATGVLSAKGEGADIFGGASCSTFNTSPINCDGTASGCEYTPCAGLGGTNAKVNYSYYSQPCGAGSTGCGDCNFTTMCVSGT
jgi:hypothetical protein